MSDLRGDPIEWLRARWEELRRQDARPELASVLEDAKRHRIRVTWRDLEWLLDRVEHESGGWSPTEYVLCFLLECLRGRAFEVLLDPAAAAPTVLLALLENGIAEEGFGLVPTRSLAEAAASVTRSRVRWRAPASVPPERGAIERVPDLIVSCPPSGMKTLKATYVQPDGTTVVVNDHAGLHVLLTATELTDSGEAWFMVSNDFFSRRGQARVHDVLSLFGLHVHAVVEIVSAFRFRPGRFSLVLIRRQPAESVWVGLLPPTTETVHLAQALRCRTVGRTPEQGRLVSWDAYQGVGRLARRERLDHLLARTGFPVVPLSKLLTSEVRPPERKSGALVEPTPNTVYLPTFLTAHARSDLDAQDLKASGYVGLCLDPNAVSSEYLALMLNSSLGRALRADLSSDGVLASLRISALRDARFPVPPLKIQRQVVKTRQTIRDVRLSLDESDKQLAERPRDAIKILRRVREIGQQDPIKPWIESLPFPLASIALRYRADAETTEKIDHLLRLFEAAAEFFATALLSVFIADEGLFTAERGRWTNENGEIPLTRATFGSWTRFGAAMAGSARRLAEAKGTDSPRSDQLAAAVGIESPAFVALVTGRDIWKLLDRLTKERNEDAHSGIKGKAEREQKLTRLEAALTELRALTSDAAQDVRLVAPGEGAYRKGVNQYRKAQNLSGNVPFPQTMLESTVQLEADELYLVDVDDEPIRGGLRLAPFIRFEPPPSTEEHACYFYSKLNGGRAEYVSHHFEKEARIPVDDPSVIMLLQRLNPSESVAP